MTPSPKPAPFFVGENPALDFLNTLAAPRSVTYDWLETGAELLDWMVAAGLVTEPEVAAFRTSSAAMDLEQARQDIIAFRERLRAFIERTAGTQPDDPAHPLVAEINAILSRGARLLQIRAPQQPTDKPLALVDVHQLATPRDLIVRIAAAAAHLLTEADFHFVRNCEGPSCTLYFLDVSKNHKRRWCSMEVCGNRAKAAAFRKR